MKKKVISLLIAILAITSFVSIESNYNSDQVQAVTLHLYTIPKRYRGHWHHKNTWLKITKHTICGTYLVKHPVPTYHGSGTLSMELKNSNSYYLAWTHGKSLWFCFPQGESANVYRSGSKLKYRVDTWTETLHR